MNAPDELALTRYSSLITEAIAAFRTDPEYVIQVAHVGRLAAQRRQRGAERREANEAERRQRIRDALG